MALKYIYGDAYLSSLVTQERENRAVTDVAAIGTFPVDWTERLVRLRAYIVTCQESQKAPDDLFAAKLATYSKEFTAMLPIARAAQDALTSNTGTGGIFSVPLERA